MPLLFCPGSIEATTPITERTNDIEKTIFELRFTPASGGKDQSTAKVGGLEGVSSADAAKSWLREGMAETNIEGVIDVYDKCKGGDFNGMVFIKFASVERRDLAMEKFNDSKNTFADSHKFMNRDLLVQHRAKFSFLLNLC